MQNKLFLRESLVLSLKTLYWPYKKNMLKCTAWNGKSAFAAYAILGSFYIIHIRHRLRAIHYDNLRENRLDCSTRDFHATCSHDCIIQISTRHKHYFIFFCQLSESAGSRRRHDPSRRSLQLVIGRTGSARSRSSSHWASDADRAVGVRTGGYRCSRRVRA